MRFKFIVITLLGLLILAYSCVPLYTGYLPANCLDKALVLADYARLLEPDLDVAIFGGYSYRNKLHAEAMFRYDDIWVPIDGVNSIIGPYVMWTIEEARQQRLKDLWELFKWENSI